MPSWIARQLSRLKPSPPPRIFLHTDADLDQVVIENLEHHVRWVARWRNSPAWQARIDRIEVNQHHVDYPAKQGSVTIGLCWTADTRRGPKPRQVWIDSRLGLYQETDTLIHEFSHAFCPADTQHELAFREVYIVAWALYRRSSNWRVREEIYCHLHRYRSAGFWAGRRETRHLLELVKAARKATKAERESKSP